MDKTFKLAEAERTIDALLAALIDCVKLLEIAEFGGDSLYNSPVAVRAREAIKQAK